MLNDAPFLTGHSTALALIPAIVLLVYIYKKDKREKEPFKLLLKCLLFGVVSTVAAVVLEELGTDLLESDLIEGSFEYALIDAFIIAALSEELCKYVMLKIGTWKSPEFNCYFDGIVYAVFVSLGFAAFENVFYVIDGGLSVALWRMFTAVPLHAFDAVFMGYFYSRAKKASLEGSRRVMRRNKRRSLLVPILLHGFYDFFPSLEEEVVGSTAFTIGLFIWAAFVIAMFVITLRMVKRASKNDEMFINEPGSV